MNRTQTLVLPRVRARMSAVREAFRLRRLALAQRSLWFFYTEHNLITEARAAHQLMLEHLRGACRQWRLNLGTAMATVETPGGEPRHGEPGLTTGDSTRI